MIHALLALTLASGVGLGSEITLQGALGGHATLPGYTVIQGAPGAPCALDLSVQADGEISVDALACEGPNEVTIRAAVAGWSFASVQPAQGQDKVTLNLELRPVTDTMGSTQLQLFVRVPGGQPGGVAVGALPDSADGPPTVLLSQVKVKKRVSPKMPEEAKELNITEARCQLRFFIDERGVPYDVGTDECPEVYVPSAMEAAWQWRFEPMLVDGIPTKAQFVLVIVYRLKN